MIILDDVATGYGRKAVAEHITAEIRSGELTCLIGPNGAGKSTLLRTLAGFLPALAGRVMLAGKPLSDYTPKELARLVSIVLTANSDIPNLSAGDVVALGRSPYTGFWGTLGDDDRKIVDEALRLTATEHLRHRMINTLSDGERQKVMIAKALAQQTPVILLDEPTAFLDFPSKISMMRLLRNLAHDLGKTVFLCNLRDFLPYMRYVFYICFINFVCAFYVSFRHNYNMFRRLGVNIVKSEHHIVLIDLF